MGSPAADWRFACPRCRHDLDHPSIAGDFLTCPGCAATYLRQDGIWRFLPPERLEQFVSFLQDYHQVRSAEQRGSEDPAYYHRLPEPSPGDPLAWQWRIRARSFTHFRKRVLPRLGEGLRVVDVGAGTGWLSNRLSLLGYYPCAAELSTDGRDGLGAARHFAPSWPRLQAEFDRLPLAAEQADLVVYNSSLHYSTDYRITLAEGLRVLRPGGRLVVIDSPIYRHDASGRQMVAERHAAFARQYGTRSDSISSIEYLTEAMLGELARDLGLVWQRFVPWYGWRWALRPWIAWLKGRREPSRFAILATRRATASGDRS